MLVKENVWYPYNNYVKSQSFTCLRHLTTVIILTDYFCNIDQSDKTAVKPIQKKSSLYRYIAIMKQQMLSTFEVQFVQMIENNVK